jgi:hypothetical protein
LKGDKSDLGYRSAVIKEMTHTKKEASKKIPAAAAAV